MIDEIEKVAYTWVNNRGDDCLTVDSPKVLPATEGHEQVEPLVRLSDVIEGGDVEYDGLKFRVKAVRLCDYCEDETKTLSIADGLALCSTCNFLLEQSDEGREIKREIQAENLGVDKTELKEEI